MSRYLCSELVVLKCDAAQTVVNLEEIWSNGAALESDDPIPVGAAVELECGESRFAATVSTAKQHEFGWWIELDFSPETPWKPEIFRPQHMVDPEELAAKELNREKIPD